MPGVSLNIFDLSQDQGPPPEPPFSPADLFDGENQANGFWYNISTHDGGHYDGLWENDELLAPATAGDLVGAMVDVAGGGNHVYQDTSNQRPIVYESSAKRLVFNYDGENETPEDEVTDSMANDAMTFNDLHTGGGFILWATVSSPSESEMVSAIALGPPGGEIEITTDGENWAVTIFGTTYGFEAAPRVAFEPTHIVVMVMGMPEDGGVNGWVYVYINGGKHMLPGGQTFPAEAEDPMVGVELGRGMTYTKMFLGNAGLVRGGYVGSAENLSEWLADQVSIED